MKVHLYGGKYDGHEVEVEEWQQHIMTPDIPDGGTTSYFMERTSDLTPLRTIAYRINWLTRSAVFEPESKR